MNIIVPTGSLHLHLAGQTDPQTVHLVVDCSGGTVTLAPDPEISGAVSSAVWHRHTIRLPCAALRAEAVEKLLRLALPLAQRMEDGYWSCWDGQNHVGRFTADAETAEEALLALCESAAGDDDATLRVWDAGDWFASLGHWDTQADALGVTADLDDASLASRVEELEAEASRDEVDVLEGTLVHLLWLRAEVRERQQGPAEEAGYALGVACAQAWAEKHPDGDCPAVPPEGELDVATLDLASEYARGLALAKALEGWKDAALDENEDRHLVIADRWGRGAAESAARQASEKCPAAQIGGDDWWQRAEEAGREDAQTSGGFNPISADLDAWDAGNDDTPVWEAYEEGLRDGLTDWLAQGWEVLAEVLEDREDTSKASEWTVWRGSVTDAQNLPLEGDAQPWLARHTSGRGWVRRQKVTCWGTWEGTGDAELLRDETDYEVLCCREGSNHVP